MNHVEATMYRMLQLRPTGDFRRDGTATFREALDDTQFVRDCVKQMLGDLHAGDPDFTELGRRVWGRVELYAQQCPAWDDAAEAEDEVRRLQRAGAC